MKIKVVIKEYLMEECGDIVFDVVDKENGMFLVFGFDTFEEAESWVRTQEDLTL
jgi:hypothetical protein